MVVGNCAQKLTHIAKDLFFKTKKVHVVPSSAIYINCIRGKCSHIKFYGIDGLITIFLYDLTNRGGFSIRRGSEFVFGFIYIVSRNSRRKKIAENRLRLSGRPASGVFHSGKTCAKFCEFRETFEGEKYAVRHAYNLAKLTENRNCSHIHIHFASFGPIQ